MTVTIGFSTTPKLSSRAIRWWTRSKVSHAWVMVPIFDHPTVLGAEWMGFVAIPYDKFKADNKIVFEQQHEVPIERIRELIDWLSTPYDFLAILKHILRPFANLRQSTPQQLMCAEAVARFVPELFPGVDPENATPELLMQLLVARKP